MKKKIIFVILGLIFVGLVNNNLRAQKVYDVISSKEPWKFGLRAGINYDGITLQQGSDYKLGSKFGLVGEKRLVYNLYFQPSLSFQNKGYKYERPFSDKGDINAYVIEVVANLLIKFGDERKGSGLFIGVAPYIAYGIGGKSRFEDLRVNDTLNYGIKEENTFSDVGMTNLDLGFQLAIGYDINNRWEIGVNYYFGLQNITYNSNFKWRGLQANITYFF